MAVNGILLGADTNSNKYLPLAGGTMTGALTLKGAPTADLQAATKKYVDNLAPLLIDTTDITSVEIMNSTIEKITASFQIRDVILCETTMNGTARCYNFSAADTSGAIFTYVENNTIILAELLYGTNAISYTEKSLRVVRRTITLSSTGWTASGSVYTQTATVSGVSATETEQEIHVTPSTASMTAYMKAGVYASAQAANKITFTASEKPTVNLTVYALIKTL